MCDLEVPSEDFAQLAKLRDGLFDTNFNFEELARQSSTIAPRFVIESGRVGYKDDGLVSRLIKKQSQSDQIDDAEAVRRLSVKVDALELGASSESIGDALKRLLGKPGTFEVRYQPSGAVSLGVLFDTLKKIGPDNFPVVGINVSTSN